MSIYKRFAVGQLAVVTLAFCVFWAYRTDQFVHTPLGPSEETYAHNWGFQLLVGGLYLIGICAATATLTVLEYFVLNAIKSAKQG